MVVVERDLQAAEGIEVLRHLWRGTSAGYARRQCGRSSSTNCHGSRRGPHGCSGSRAGCASRARRRACSANTTATSTARCCRRWRRTRRSPSTTSRRWSWARATPCCRRASGSSSRRSARRSPGPRDARRPRRATRWTARPRSWISGAATGITWRSSGAHFRARRCSAASSRPAASTSAGGSASTSSRSTSSAAARPLARAPRARGGPALDGAPPAPLGGGRGGRARPHRDRVARVIVYDALEGVQPDCTAGPAAAPLHPAQRLLVGPAGGALAQGRRRDRGARAERHRAQRAPARLVR